MNPKSCEKQLYINGQDEESVELGINIKGGTMSAAPVNCLTDIETRWVAYRESPSSSTFLDFLTPIALEILATNKNTTDLSLKDLSANHQPSEGLCLFKSLWIDEVKHCINSFQIEEQEHLQSLLTAHQTASEEEKATIIDEINRFAIEKTIDPRQTIESVISRFNKLAKLLEEEKGDLKRIEARLDEEMAEAKGTHEFYQQTFDQRLAYLRNNEWKRVEFIYEKIKGHKLGEEANLFKKPKTPLERQKDDIEIKAFSQKINIQNQIYDLELDLNFFQKKTSKNAVKINELIAKLETLYKEMQACEAQAKDKLEHLNKQSEEKTLQANEPEEQISLKEVIHQPRLLKENTEEFEERTRRKHCSIM